MAQVNATNLLVGGSVASSNSYTTASVTLQANTLILLAITLDNGGTPAPTINTPTMTGVTFVQIGTITDAGGTRRTSLFRTMATAQTTGTITIGLGATLGTDGINWSVDSFSNVDITGSNGANAIVQSNTGTESGGTSLTITLGAFSNTNNATYGAIGMNANFAITAGSGFSQLGQVTNKGQLQTEFDTVNNTSVSWSWTGGAVTEGVGVEIKFVNQTIDNILGVEI